MIKIISEAIDSNEVLHSVLDSSAGATSVFIGTTRNNANGKPVLRLEYEAYEDMAITVIQQLIEDALQKWNLCRVSIIHRIGIVNITEASVMIAVSAPHRNEAFEACRYLIDKLKQDVPIWKKEFFVEEAVWVDSRNA